MRHTCRRIEVVVEAVCRPCPEVSPESGKGFVTQNLHHQRVPYTGRIVDCPVGGWWRREGEPRKRRNDDVK